MKYIFGLLFTINLGLFAYFNSEKLLPSSPKIKTPEIAPEKIVVLSEQALANQITATAKPAEINPVELQASLASTCYEWGVFADTNIANAQSALAKLALQSTIKEQTSQQAKRFWVYRSPAKSAAEVQAKVNEIKALGVHDMFVVQEPNWKNAISFGIFSDEKLAINLQKELQAKGVRNVEKSLRSQGKHYSSLLINNPSEPQLAEIKKLKPDFPAAELKEASCS
ncbi:MAG: sporulation protein [Betaproteobacteria bacterium HGW-Betaproteobacteria-22]|nr:MAG: sporulation protein [Betaproteobacteria bacterium HGW-Betaproteobacteria-22]